ncbi:MAG: PAC2 family protein [Aeromicrobium sp.]|uniref:proteasome assembly chaperone family protein n=1 Tax=Aeromicrobium sp. TaxID=1871063 RepID=UPI0039E34308
MPEPTVLIVALEGFLSAGSGPRLAVEHLLSGHGEVVHSFDIDAMLDYRARRPTLRFAKDHYLDYDAPRLDVVREHDQEGRAYYVLSGPEPDFLWERFAAETREVIEDLGIDLTLSLAAVPMGVPHTRPLLVTAHGTAPELVDRTNLWSAELTVPSSAQSMLEYRLGSWGYDAAGYVAHVPHYLAQVDYPGAAVALLEAITDRLGLRVDLTGLRERHASAMVDIERQIADQHGTDLVVGLEEQYDAFTRGAAQSLLASEDALPSADELAGQFEEYLARHHHDGDMS